MTNNLFTTELNIDDPNLIVDERVRQVFKELLTANVNKNGALKILDRKLQLVTKFLLNICNDKEGRESTRKNARKALEYCNLKDKNPF